MQFTSRTLTILKNFVSIYPSMAFKKGSTIQTMSAAKSIIAKAVIVEEIPVDFCVYDLSKFLSTISLFENPEIEFQENHCIIKSGKSKVNYYFALSNLIQQPPDREIHLPSIDAKFELSNASLQEVMKASRTLGLSHIAVIGDGSKLSLAVLDATGAISDQYMIEVGETDQIFKAVFDINNIKLLDGDYQVEVCSAGIADFTCNDVSYKILMDKKNSEF